MTLGFLKDWAGILGKVWDGYPLLISPKGLQSKFPYGFWAGKAQAKIGL